MWLSAFSLSLLDASTRNEVFNGKWRTLFGSTLSLFEKSYIVDHVLQYFRCFCMIFDSLSYMYMYIKLYNVHVHVDSKFLKETSILYFSRKWVSVIFQILFS